MMRRRPDSTARLHADAAYPGGRGFSFDAPAGAIVTSVSPKALGYSDEHRGPQRSITAAARVLSGEGLAGTRVRIPTESWQKEVWDLRHEVGELRFVGDRQASAVSGLRLFIGKKPKPGAQPVPVDDGAIAELSEAMFGDAAATQQALNRAARHIIYTGETEIVVKENGDDRSWYPWSAQEVTGSSENGWKINDGLEQRPLGEDELLVRCWSPAPERQQFADAPTQSIIPVARELVGLTQYVGAQIDSRLAGAGLLLVPQGIVPMPGQGYAQDVSFAKALMSAMITPVQNRDSAASLVPLIAEVDPALIDKIQHIKFDSVLDPKAHELRDEAIRRIGLGMDSDPSILLGMNTANHWSGWLISEDEVRLAVAPIGATVCHALTSGWLRPYLAAAEIADAASYQVWFDATPLELRPDRSKDAQALHASDAVSNETLRRENGFSDEDAPSDDELLRRILLRLADSQPQLAPPILKHLFGVDLDMSLAVSGPTEPAADDDDTEDPEAPDSSDVQFDVPSTLDEGPQQ